MQTTLDKELVIFLESAHVNLRSYPATKDPGDLRKLWQGLYKNNLISESNSFTKNVLLTKTICKTNSGIGLFLLTQFACIELIKNYGTEEIKDKFLKKLYSGEYISSFSLTETNAGSDINRIETTVKNENNSWVVNGHKIWSSNGSISDVIVLFAQAKSHEDKNSISCFIAESKSPGIEILKDTPKLGVKITPSNEIYFKNLNLPKSNLIGNIGDGIKIALSTITSGRIFCASQAIGLLEGILSESIKHSTKRNQFGKSISDYQAIKWFIADMSKDLNAGKILLYKACWAKETNSPEATKLSSMAKFFCTEKAQNHSTKAVQILGGSGLRDDSYVAKGYRDSKVLEVYEGTNEIQKLIIAKELRLN